MRQSGDSRLKCQFIGKLQKHLLLVQAIQPQTASQTLCGKCLIASQVATWKIGQSRRIEEGTNQVKGKGAGKEKSLSGLKGSLLSRRLLPICDPPQVRQLFRWTVDSGHRGKSAADTNHGAGLAIKCLLCAIMAN